MKFLDTVFPSCNKIKISYWIVIFGSVHFFVDQLPNFNSIAGISLATTFMSLSYSTIAWGSSGHNGREPDVSYDYRDTTVSNHVFGVFNALG